MKRVLLLLPKGVEIYETAAFIDVIGWANRYGDEPMELVTAATEPELRSTFGLRILADRLIADLDPAEFDALALPGGFEEFGFYEDACSEPFAALIRGFDAAAKPIASICVGALPLASSGVLAGRRATTYHLGDGRRRRQLADFGVEVKDAALVSDGHIVTSTSPATAVGVALTLVAALTSEANAAKIRGLMGFDETATGPAARQ